MGEVIVFKNVKCLMRKFVGMLMMVVMLKFVFMCVSDVSMF